MRLSIHDGPTTATEAACLILHSWLEEPNVSNIMCAGGNSPLRLYREIARHGLNLAGIRVFALDEYVGVPLDEFRTVSNLLRRSVVDAWRVPRASFFPLSPLPNKALSSIQQQESIIRHYGGLDILILGLGQNGHVGFNEPGSTETDVGRLVPLESSSVAANSLWFGGTYAPDIGVTVGLRTLLSARRVIILAFSDQKATAVRNMVEGHRRPSCPASFFQGHPETRVFLDDAAASQLSCNRQEMAQ